MPEKRADVNPTAAFSRIAKFGAEKKVDNGTPALSSQTHKRRSRASNEGNI